jgi:hypothetical protein
VVLDCLGQHLGGDQGMGTVTRARNPLISTLFFSVFIVYTPLTRCSRGPITGLQYAD